MIHDPGLHEGLVAGAQVFNEKLKGLVVLNLAEAQGKSNEEARQAIAKYNELTVLDSMIIRRKVYSESISKGRGVMEMRTRNGKAVVEFNTLVKELWRI